MEGDISAEPQYACQLLRVSQSRVHSKATSLREPTWREGGREGRRKEERDRGREGEREERIGEHE